MTIVRACYFFANSDVTGLVLRLALDVGLLLVGIGLYSLFGQFRHVPEVDQAPATLPLERREMELLRVT